MEAAKDKLHHYYHDTYSFHGSIYAIAIILDPRKKLHVFNTSSWKNDNTNWYTVYEKLIFDVFDYYRNNNPGVSMCNVSRISYSSDALDNTLRSLKRRKITSTSDSASSPCEPQSDEDKYGELTKYLNERESVLIIYSSKFQNLTAVPFLYSMSI